MRLVNDEQVDTLAGAQVGPVQPQPLVGDEHDRVVGGSRLHEELELNWCGDIGRVSLQVDDSELVRRAAQPPTKFLPTIRAISSACEGQSTRLRTARA